jgi:hypothetical protein
MFTINRKRMLLEKAGFTRHDAELMMEKSPKNVARFERAFKWWERKTKQKKHYRVADGITKDALYSMRDILREMPRHLNKSWDLMPIERFMDHITSTYCGAADSKPNFIRSIKATELQKAYMTLIETCARLTEARRENMVGRVMARAEILNRRERVTGDAICNVGEKILRSRKQLPRKELFGLISTFIDAQILVPDHKLKPVQRSTVEPARITTKAEVVLKALDKVVRDLRHGL